MRITGGISNYVNIVNCSTFHFNCNKKTPEWLSGARYLLSHCFIDIHSIINTSCGISIFSISLILLISAFTF